MEGDRSKALQSFTLFLVFHLHCPHVVFYSDIPPHSSTQAGAQGTQVTEVHNWR